MPIDTTSLSLTDLERLIEERSAHVQSLLQKREELESAIADIDAQMQDLLQTGGTRKKAKRRRAVNEASLRSVVLGILAKKKKGLSIRDLAGQVLATGYQSHSRKFENVIYQCVYNTAEIVKDDDTGLYRLKR